MFGWLTDRFRRKPKMVPPAEQLAHLDKWAAGFEGIDPPLEDPHYWNWKISCSSGMFQPPVVTREIEERAINALLTAAGHLSRTPYAVEFPYFRAAVLLPMGDLFMSEVTAFYDRDYALRFWSGEPLPVERVTEKYDLNIPEGFELHGTIVAHPLDDEDVVEGMRIDEDGKRWFDEERWVIGQRP
ncbi:DUF3916 domain-containing protein [Parvularcula flava]|uniref:DUF3916 domain-containing protein n=1 Tax=Aquisalinus luteolus TaxID=1566827 RepID=A0A8J3A372_9PROT|nr:DUF3916 domain-containing protein [Aquisalinus luteolus]NHK27877.1 DUF3916 domain-containing protein [Aquisalinus luteolus]GGH96774.1 hypothetical protein GCM10011355_16470 [Aquisalinus luteolus]